MGTLLLNIKQISEYLNIKQKTIYKKVEKGEIPYYKIGSLVRFKKEEIDHWLESFRNGKEREENNSSKKIRRKKLSHLHNNHIDKITRKIIDGETTKYYHNNHGKSDLIKAQEKGE
jgi:excisionase family DNA binding protein